MGTLNMKRNIKRLPFAHGGETTDGSAESNSRDHEHALQDR